MKPTNVNAGIIDTRIINSQMFIELQICPSSVTNMSIRHKFHSQSSHLSISFSVLVQFRVQYSSCNQQPTQIILNLTNFGSVASKHYIKERENPSSSVQLLLDCCPLSFCLTIAYPNHALNLRQE